MFWKKKKWATIKNSKSSMQLNNFMLGILWDWNWIVYYIQYQTFNSDKICIKLNWIKVVIDELHPVSSSHRAVFPKIFFFSVVRILGMNICSRLTVLYVIKSTFQNNEESVLKGDYRRCRQWVNIFTENFLFNFVEPSYYIILNWNNTKISQQNRSIIDYKYL